VRPKPVLFISTMEGASWGGSEELWSACAMDLLRRRCEVTVCVKRWPKVHPAVNLLSQSGAVIRYRNPDSPFLRLAKYVRYFPASFLRQSHARFAVISQGCSFEGVEWMEACQTVAMPYVVIIHLALPWIWPSDQRAERFRLAYAGAAKVYFVSEGNLTLTQRQLDHVFTNSKIVRNPFKVPHDSRFAWPSEDVPRWGCVARLDTYMKGLDILLDVLEKDKWRNRSLRVTFYGTGGNEKSLKSSSGRKNLLNVEFAGYVPNPADIWRREHCLILPSRAEGLPLVVVEAMLCGRLCIVTNVGGNAEFIQDNADGFIAKSDCVMALDEAMERAWQNRHLWKAMGERAGTSIRRFVPAEPAKVFADELLSLF
jgi:glycosyltransferase involved in cell wall biosynthesis